MPASEQPARYLMYVRQATLLEELEPALRVFGIFCAAAVIVWLFGSTGLLLRIFVTLPIVCGCLCFILYLYLRRDDNRIIKIVKIRKCV